MYSDMQDWERNHGMRFFEKIGLKPGHKVIDFGSSIGHYTIPAAHIVGNTGSVYAIDTDDKALKMLRNKARIHMLNNIQLERINGKPRLEFGGNTIDMFLLYDVLHFFNVEDRQKLYKEVRRVLKPEGILSIFPKHVADDNPAMELAESTLEQLIEEISECGFTQIEQLEEIISYEGKLAKGRIVNYSGSI